MLACRAQLHPNGETNLLAERVGLRFCLLYTQL